MSAIAHIYGVPTRLVRERGRIYRTLHGMSRAFVNDPEYRAEQVARLREIEREIHGYIQRTS